MDPTTARWAQIVYFAEEDIQELHSREKYLSERLSKGQPYRFQTKTLATWQATSFIRMKSESLFKMGYWPPHMDHAAQAISLDSFRRQIFPIWKGIQDKDFAAAKLEEAPVMPDCLTLHKQDLAIYRSGFKPEKIVLSQEDATKMRKKAAAAEKFREWNQ